MIDVSPIQGRRLQVFKVFIEYPLNLGSDCISMFSVNDLRHTSMMKFYCFAWIAWIPYYKSQTPPLIFLITGGAPKRSGAREILPLVPLLTGLLSNIAYILSVKTQLSFRQIMSLWFARHTQHYLNVVLIDWLIDWLISRFLHSIHSAWPRVQRSIKVYFYLRANRTGNTPEMASTLPTPPYPTHSYSPPCSKLFSCSFTASCNIY